MDLFSLIFAIIVSLGVFAGCLYGLQHLWLKPHQSEIPLDINKNYANSPQTKLNNEEIAKVKSLKELFDVYIPLLLSLDSRYWIHHIGLDGYTYLYFQRVLIKLLLVFGVVSFVVMIPVSIWFGSLKIHQNLDDFILESDTENIRHYQQVRAIINCSMSYFFTLSAIYTMFGIKRYIRKKIDQQNLTKATRHDYELLKSRSVHVRGVFPEDRKGEILGKAVQSYLTISGGGSIVATLIIPDFVRIIELEGDRKRVDNAYKLYVANEPAVRRIFFPKKFRDEAYYQRKLNSIDDKVENIKDFEDASKTWKDLWEKISQEALQARGKRSVLKRQFTSTFQKFDEEDILRDMMEKELKIVMTPLERPSDLLWSNMGGTRERRLIINLIAFCALIFLSTPAALSAVIQKIPIISTLDISQYIPSDSQFGNLLRQLVLPIWIVSLNQLLLFLIDYAAYMEKHYSFTLCQMSIFSKSFFYQAFNMMIIPALTLVTSGSNKNISQFTSLYTLFKGIIFEGESIAIVLRQLYSSTSGVFFVNVLFQNGAYGAGFSLLKLGDIINAFGSTWLAHYQRNLLNDSDRWRKKESDVFKYGFLCAQIVVAFAIIISFSVSTPGIILAGLSFLIMRHAADGFSLLTVFKKEIDSEGQMISSILKYTTLACLLHQIAMAVSFAYSGYVYACMFISILCLITIYFSYKISQPISAEEGPEEQENSETNQDQPNNTPKASPEDIQKWETAYRHPLLVGPSEVSISRGERTLSYIPSANL